jgi:hypothetical protein
MDSGPRRDTLSFLGVVFSASSVVAVALPRSLAAPLISAFVPVGVLLVLTPFLSRSVWRGLGLNRSGFRLWPAAIAHATGNTLLAFVASAALPATSVSMAYIAGEGGWATAAVMTAVAIAVLRIARRTVWRRSEQTQLIST